MKKKNPLHPLTRWFSHNKKSLVPILAIVILGVGSLSFALHAASLGSSSPEAKFTDASHSGLTIVPASAASGPTLCPSGYSGTYPNCTPNSGGKCLPGYTGTYPNCVRPPAVCPTGYSGTYPNCYATSAGGKCATGYTGIYPNCVGPVGGICPTGYTGTYPNCVGPAGGKCPTGYTGTYPNCVAPVPGICPAGYTGTYPNCTGPSTGICPTGFTGTYPDCIGPPVVGAKCPTGYTGTYPDCVGPPNGVCPTGYTGTYPYCVGPARGICPTGFTGTFPNCVGPTITNTCPTGDTGIYPNCVPPSGKTGNPIQCLINDTCGIVPINGTCPLGYWLSNGLCIFSSCPAGYILSGSACVVNTSTSSSCTPQYVCGADGNLYQEDATCAISSSPAQACGYGCTGNACLPPPAPIISKFLASPSLVKKGNTTTVTWNVSNVQNCTITGSNGTVWTQPAGSTSWSGTQATAPITGQTVYTLHCSVLPGAVNSNNTPAVWVDQTVTVNIIPVFIEK